MIKIFRGEEMIIFKDQIIRNRISYNTYKCFHVIITFKMSVKLYSNLQTSGLFSIDYIDNIYFEGFAKRHLHLITIHKSVYCTFVVNKIYRCSSAI